MNTDVKYTMTNSIFYLDILYLVISLVLMMFFKNSVLLYFFILIFLLLIFLILYHFYLKKTRYCYISNDQLIISSGLIVKNQNVYPLSKISNINLRQSVIGKLFNYGRVDIKTVTEEVNIKWISNPYDFTRVLKSSALNP